MKKRNRSGSGLTASSRDSMQSIIATGAARDIITTKEHNSITSAARLPPPIRPSLPLVDSEAYGVRNDVISDVRATAWTPYFA